MQFDAIVVGARVAGCATAFALAQRGWHVALVERKHRPLGGTLSLPITSHEHLHVSATWACCQ
jgi:flavin-dependent dehydrogenase